jgi:hypothetical protein
MDPEGRTFSQVHNILHLFFLDIPKNYTDKMTQESIKNTLFHRWEQVLSTTLLHVDPGTGFLVAGNENGGLQASSLNLRYGCPL